MEKMFKLFFVFLFALSLSINVYAEESADTGKDTQPVSDSQVEKQKKATEAYCDENAKLSGCIYDKNNPVYTKFPSGKHQVIHYTNTSGAGGSQNQTYDSNGYLTISKDVDIVRGYQSFDGNGNAVYAACYRYKVTEEEAKQSGAATGPGTVFIFSFVTDNGQACGRSYYTIIPSEGMEGRNYKVTSSYAANEVFTKVGTYKFDGKTGIWGNKLNFNNWKATENGACPKLFGYTANTKWYTSTSNKYTFSENAEDFNIETYAFWTGEQYVSRPGCTVEDVDGKEKADELLAEIKKEIDNYACPSNIEDMLNFSNELDDYYQKLRDDNEYRVLWSAGLIDEVTRQSVQKEIEKKISEKMTSCQYQVCNVSSSEVSLINSQKGATCKNGCKLSSKPVQSTDENAKCYCCGTSTQGCTFIWSTPGPGSSCALQPDMKIGDCVGTTKDLECRNCLITAYEKSDLSQEKIACLIRTEILKELTEQSLLDENESAAEEDIQQEIEENKQLREDIFNHTLNVPDFEFYTGTMSCEVLLGDQLIKVIKFIINLVRIGAVIATIVLCMMTMLPAVTKGDAGEFNKAVKKCIWTVVVMLLIILAPVLLRTIGNLFNWDLCGLF